MGRKTRRRPGRIVTRYCRVCWAKVHVDEMRDPRSVVCPMCLDQLSFDPQVVARG